MYTYIKFNSRILNLHFNPNPYKTKPILIKHGTYGFGLYTKTNINIYIYTHT